MEMEKEPNFLTQAADVEGSSLTRSFWFGKYFQQLSDDELHDLGLSGSRLSLVTPSQPSSVSSTGPGSSTISEDGDRKENKLATDVRSSGLRFDVMEAVKCLKDVETSLSPNVHDITVSPTHSLPLDRLSAILESTFLLNDCTLDWDAVALHLETDGCKDYSLGAQICATIAKKVYRELSDEMLLLLTKGGNFYWTQSPQLFIECVRELQAEDNILRVNTSLLLGTAAFERALGDVYLTVSKATLCPPLLRDLLATAELETTFGKTIMYVLSCLIGPPSGLNLRNLLWHGFVSPNEISQEFAYLFFIIVSSLGKVLRSAATPSQLPLNHRTFVSFPQETIISKVFPEIKLGDLEALDKLLSRSFFILPSMLTTWRAALEAFKTNRHGHCVAILLPCLEHSLRRVFACVNGCPERVLTAESSALYTTFDEILSPVISSGQENKLKSEIGTSKLEMLLDLLIHAEGPRIRDRISHGEVDFFSLSKVVSSYVVSLAAVFCLQYSIGVDRHSEQVYRTFLHQELNYVSLFHPISLLRRELEELSLLVHNWRKIPKPDFWSDKAENATHKLAAFETVFKVFGSAHKVCLPVEDRTHEQVEGLIATTWDRPIATLYVSRNDLEVVGVMRRTVENAHAAAGQIHEMASLRFRQYQERTLRSRQRTNYDHLLDSVMLYSNTVVVLIILLASVAAKLPCDESDSCKSLLQFLKKVLQVGENFKSQTSSTRNRWEEADKLCMSLAALTERLLSVCMPELIVM